MTLLDSTPTARENRQPETFGDEEFNWAMEEALREDRELLEKLAES